MPACHGTPRNFCYWIAVAHGHAVPALFSLDRADSAVGRSLWRSSMANLRAALPARRPGAGQAAGSGGERTARQPSSTGANPIDVLIEIPERRVALFDSGDACRRSRRCSQGQSKIQAGVGERLVAGNAATLACRKSSASSDVATLKEYVNLIPEHLVRPFYLDPHQDAVVVSGRVPDVDSSQASAGGGQTRPFELDAVRAKPIRAMKSPSPAFRRSRRVTAPSMIGKAQSRADGRIRAWSPSFIGLAFRSVDGDVLLSILPGIFPVVLSGTLAVPDGGRATVCQRRRAHRIVWIWGLSATIHFLNRLHGLRTTPGVEPANWRIQNARPCWSVRRSF